MKPELVRILVCPNCGGDLRENAGALICSAGHTANIARQGYVSLLGPHSGTHTADSAEMVAARERFLGAGHFRPVADAIGEAVDRALDPRSDRAGGTVPDGAVIDLGAGTGYYLAAALGAGDRAAEPGPGAAGRIGLAIDNSKFAARRAARCHPRAGAIVADIWDDLPVRTGSAAVVLDVFAPRNGDEIRRILAPGGILAVVTPNADHLHQLGEGFGMISVDPDKEARLEQTLGDLADGLEGRDLEWQMELDRNEVRDLVGMGPGAGRLEPSRLEAALARLPEPATVTGSVRISTTFG